MTYSDKYDDQRQHTINIFYLLVRLLRFYTYISAIPYRTHQPIRLQPLPHKTGVKRLCR